MDKTILKSFATESRNKLIEDVIYRLNLLGITEDKIYYSISESEGIEHIKWVIPLIVFMMMIL